MNGSKKRRPLRCIFWGLALCGCLGAVGCQSDFAGQTLPNPWYMTDDVQYFAPGSEFILAKEGAAMKTQAAETTLQQQR